MNPMTDYPALGPWINGQLRAREEGSTSSVLNPATGDVVGTLPHASDADIDEALAGARQAFAAWKRTSVMERSRVLRDAAATLRRKSACIATHITLEQGKPRAEAQIEVNSSAEHLEWHAEECRRLYGRVIPARGDSIHQYVVREPVGVVAALTPWNFPMSQAVRKVAAALGAGCTVVLKGPENATSAIHALAQALHEAGLPPGCLQLVWGDPATVANRLIDSPIVRAVSFTGSVAVGKMLAVRASARLQKLTLELGGHAPAIVCEDCDVSQAALVLARAKFRNAGQVCIAPSRIFVHEKVAEAFTHEFTEHARRLVMGDGLSPSTTMGPLAHAGRKRALIDLTQDAVARGAVLALGGTAPEGPGNFFAPTILLDVAADARVMTDEPFGPIAPLVRWKALDDVLGRANSLAFGLAGFAFTRDNKTIGHIASQLQVGQLAVNHAGLALAELPVSGVGDSGLGSEGGAETFDGYLQTKLVSNCQD